MRQNQRALEDAAPAATPPAPATAQPAFGRLQDGAVIHWKVQERRR
jgi:hypothetical protein